MGGELEKDSQRLLHNLRQERERGVGGGVGGGMVCSEEKRRLFFPGDIWLWLSGAVWKGQSLPFVLTGLMGEQICRSVVLV